MQSRNKRDEEKKKDNLLVKAFFFPPDLFVVFFEAFHISQCSAHDSGREAHAVLFWIWL